MGSSSCDVQKDKVETGNCENSSDVTQHSKAIAKTEREPEVPPVSDSNNENIIIIGPPGVGKSMIATGIGRKACKAGNRVLFVSAQDLLDKLSDSAKDGSLKEYIEELNKIPLLIIDELSYLRMDKEKESINDASQFRCMIDKARGYGYRKCAFILDRGYFIPANIRYMDENGYDFIIMVKGMKELVNGLVMEHRNTFETDRRCSIAEYGAYGKTVETKVFASDEKDRYVHIYYSPSKSASERSSLEKSIERTRKVLKRCEGKVKELDKSYERYFELQYEKKGKKDQRFVCAIERRGEIEKQLKLCGYFCIITSQEMDAKDALRIYKSRDESEKLFMVDKTFLGGSSMRVHSAESAEAKIFIEFIALIIRNRIYRLLKDEMIRSGMQANYMTVPTAIKELDKMEMIRQVGDVYKRDHALTKTQKTILRAFGMDSNDVTRQEKMIAEELNPKVVIEKISGGI